MKRFILFVISVLVVWPSKAQDLIVLKEANEIVAKVLMVSAEYVQYKRWDNIDGPTYEICKSDIFYIKYQNGEKVVMDTDFLQKKIVGFNTDRENKVKIDFMGYMYVGCVFDKVSAGPTYDITAGVNIGNFIYVGPEIGFYTNFDSSNPDVDATFSAYIPLGGNVKVYFLKDAPVIPYFNCTLSGFWGVAGSFKNDINGFCCQLGLGIDAPGCSFSIGYAPLKVLHILNVPTRITAHCGYVKLGVKF